MWLRGLQPFLLALVIGCSGRSNDASGAPPKAELLPLRDQLAKLGGSFLTEPPPASLDQFYPPKTQRMVYRDLMRDLYLPLSFAKSQTRSGDWDGARRAWARFMERFGKARVAVPEWDSRYGPANEWEAAGSVMASGHTPEDAKRFQTAVSAAYAETCEACHQIERMRVYARYHFGDFRTAWVTPPTVDDWMLKNALTEWKGKQDIPDGTVSFRDYMKLMNTQAMDVLNFTDAGDLDGARSAMGKLETYLGAFAPACAQCHGGELRRYYIDPESLEKFHVVTRALAEPKVDRAAVIEKFNDAYDFSCSRCHNVHLLPAKLQRSWALAKEQVAPLQ